MCSPYDEIASVSARHEYVLVSLRFMVEVVMSTIHVLLKRRAFEVFMSSIRCMVDF